jgi:hypothetical protein
VFVSFSNVFTAFVKVIDKFDGVPEVTILVTDSFGDFFGIVGSITEYVLHRFLVSIPVIARPSEVPSIVEALLEPGGVVSKTSGGKTFLGAVDGHSEPDRQREMVSDVGAAV